jgi:4-hydroxybenzoate polyprenyltransferase
MQMATSRHHAAAAVADAHRGNWVDRFAPDWLKPYARLARWDRPIGFWLLFWPCGYSLALVAPLHGFNWLALLEMFIGAIAMRGAGCTLNDIVDAELDAKVTRTRSRPIPSGQVTETRAAIFLALQLIVGAAIVVTFNLLTVGLAVASLVLVAIYPFMKRITWWPQLFLGLAFSWGALIGWTSQAGSLSPVPLVLYLGCIFWVIGYDTIYALQDVEDDALAGIKSTARLFGDQVKTWVATFYIAAVVCWLVAAAFTGDVSIFVLTLIVPAGLLGWQVVTLEPGNPRNALRMFKANNWVGLTLTAALLLQATVA